MNPSEAATVLGVIVSVDARLTARSKEDAENRSKAWALTLDTDMPVELARGLALTHYRESTDSLMPATLNRLWRQHRKTIREAERAIIESESLREQALNAVPMPDDFKALIHNAMEQIGK